MFEVGTGKADITGFKPGVGMLGYGMFHNRVDGVETNLNARAFVIKDLSSNKKVAFVNTETAFITISVKRGVMKRLKRKHAELGYDYDNVLMTAQHTHSGPGGYSHYGLYNISTPGFVPEVYQAIVEGITDAILQAEANLQPAKITMNKGTFAPDVEVAFNRSLDAYNANPDVQPKLAKNETHLAVDREMTLFRVDDLKGNPIGSFNFFGVHTTSVHNDNTKICFDNKGYAAQFHEEEMQAVNPNFISIFAQNTTGDITPNYIWDKKKKWTRGIYEDDFECARHNGKLQFEKAREIFTQSPKQGESLHMGIDHALMYANLGSIYPDPEFTNGDKDAHTGPACLGVAFMKGTVEGPGMVFPIDLVATIASRVVKAFEYVKALFVNKKERRRIYDKYKVQGKKDIMIESGDRKLLGTYNVSGLIVPSFLDPTIKYFKYFHGTGGLDLKPWTPQTLPLQIITIGQVAFVGMPGEITTIAGKRLKETVQNVLKEKGITEVVIASYANAYCGYTTTYEEYQLQKYEGGHTPYGEWTLAAFQTKFKELAQEMLKSPEQRNREFVEKPVKFSDEELQKRIFAYQGK